MHLFIIWSNARNIEDRILNDINEKFNIKRIYEISWSKDFFSQNLTRFYGQNLPPNSSKEKHCGNKPFLLILVTDENPHYEERHTSKGNKTVNINTFDSKTLYRDWSGGGHRIHATNSTKETNHDLTLLLGKNAKDFEKENSSPWNGNQVSISCNIVGAEGWDNINQVFYVLNSTIDYVILRNFESLPEELNLPGHNDIDLLVTSYYDAKCIMNAKNLYPQKYRVANSVRVKEKDIHFDIRFVGDSYYDNKWQQNILEKKIFSEKGFFILDEKNYFYSLLYHAMIHKNKISEDYINRLIYLGQNRLGIEMFDLDMLYSPDNLKMFMDIFLKENNYDYCEPKDLSVGCNLRYVNPHYLSFRRKYRNLKQTARSLLKRVVC